MSEEFNYWPPKPLVIGDRILHWMQWDDVRLLTYVQTAEFGQVRLEFQKTGEVKTFNDPLLRTWDQLEDGALYRLVGLGEPDKSAIYKFEAIIRQESLDPMAFRELRQGILNECYNAEGGVPQVFNIPRNKRHVHRALYNYHRAMLVAIQTARWHLPKEGYDRLVSIDSDLYARDMLKNYWGEKRPKL